MSNIRSGKFGLSVRDWVYQCDRTKYSGRWWANCPEYLVLSQKFTKTKTLNLLRETQATIPI